MKQDHWERNINSQEFSTETCSSEDIDSTTPKIPHVKQSYCQYLMDLSWKAIPLENQPSYKSKGPQIKEQSH